MLPGAVPLLLSADLAAELLGVSKSAFYRMDTAGRIPRANRFGTTKRWSRHELHEWVAGGCPNRIEWEKQR